MMMFPKPRECTSSQHDVLFTAQSEKILMESFTLAKATIFAVESGHSRNVPRQEGELDTWRDGATPNMT